MLRHQMPRRQHPSSKLIPYSATMNIPGPFVTILHITYKYVEYSPQGIIDATNCTYISLMHNVLNGEWSITHLLRDAVIHNSSFLIVSRYFCSFSVWHVNGWRTMPVTVYLLLSQLIYDNYPLLLCWWWWWPGIIKLISANKKQW